MKNKKALIISNTIGLITDFLENDIKILSEAGYEINLACNKKYKGKDTESFLEKYRINNIYQVDFPIRNIKVKQIIKSIVQVKKILKDNNYQLVHCHSTIAATIGRLCAKKYRKNGTKVFYTCHGFPFYEGNRGKKAKIFYLVEKYFSKYTDVLITICNEDYENAKKMRCKKVYKINGVGVEIEKIINCNVNANEYRKKIGIDNNKKFILSIGEINTNKNHEVMIKAIGLMKEKEKIVYGICGREVTEKGKKKELEKTAKELNVKVCFFGYRKDIPEICKCADIGALPSFKEGLGLSGIEMLAAGIPVVASNRQGIKDYIINGKTGFLCNPDSKEDFKIGIEKTLELKKKDNTKTNCIDVAKQFSKKDAYKKMKEIYKGIL